MLEQYVDCEMRMTCVGVMCDSSRCVCHKHGRENEE